MFTIVSRLIDRWGASRVHALSLALTTFFLWNSLFGGRMPAFLSPTVERTLYFKLPIAGEEYHWRFRDGKAFLAGELTLRIVNPSRERDDTLVVFRHGVIRDGWQMISQSNPDSAFYFGFSTAQRVPTSVGDSLILTLVAPTDLRGIGPYREGTLAAGTWQATGTYSSLYGGTLNPLHNIVRWGQAPIAFMECWDTVWPVSVTNNRGWMQGAAPEEDGEESVFEASLMHRGVDGRQCVSHR